MRVGLSSSSINLELVLGKALKKRELWQFCGLIFAYEEVTGEKLVLGAFCSPLII